ncbi:hypothetical protein ECDEC1A_0767 [Escherichia coli DEC1A]|nr:hypothetical protein ECDEC1A_0767 [Escherichia coli DEC1A]
MPIKFWRRCRRDGLGKRIYLFKGDSIRRAKLITRTFPDNTGRTGRRAQAAGDVPLWLLQTDALKDRMITRYGVTRQVPAMCISLTGWGAGFTTN